MVNKGLIFIALFVTCAFLCLSSLLLAYLLPDTGQTKCYDDTQEITCPQPGEPFYGQDAQYPCNPQSYTKLDANGNDLPDDVPWPWAMVRDNVTGLIWEMKTDDGTIHDKNNWYNWYDAQDVFIAALNNDNFGGFSNWRLPTIKELMSIVNRDSYLPSINTTYFPNTLSLIDWWSSTTYASHPYFAWLVNFLGGFMLQDDKLNYGYIVRAVRGGQTGSFDNFVDNGDGTVTDTSTGLMWEVKTDDGGPRNKYNLYTWQQALAYCEDLSLGGYDDWRLPDINELQSIVDYDRYSPSIDPIFSNTLPWFYWSSTTFADDTYNAWIVNFDDGYVGYILKSFPYSYGLSVRAVRWGQCGSSSTTTTTAVNGSTTTTIFVISSTTTTTICPTEEIYGEHSEQIEFLRYFRDSILSQTAEGQELIKLYYQWSPMIVQAMEEDEGFKEEAKEMIDGILPLVEKLLE